MFGVLGLAAARKESEAYVTVTTRDGDWVLEVSGTLPSPLRGRLSPVLRNLEADSPQPSPPHEDPLDIIRRLGELRDQGLISEAEFAAKKAELLDRM